jgi:N utilization substance protein B
MLSRRHVRVKVLQALYAYANSGDTANQEQVKKQMIHNIYQLYDLYLYLLLFLKEFGLFVAKYDEENKAPYLPNLQSRGHILRLHDNPIMQALINSRTLAGKLDWKQVAWQGDNDLLRKVFYDLKNTDYYQDYIHSDEEQVYEDAEMLKHILKHYTEQFSLISQHMEEFHLNWHDDKKIARQMVIKTINNLANDPDQDNLLVALSTNEDDNLNFARELYTKGVEEAEHLEAKIHGKTGKFEPSQLALVDFNILKMGAAEFLYFSSIPTRVTMNEYIEIAKNYSSPQSKKFVNGVLDNMRKEMESQGEVLKSGRGLYES